jgi:hypothetical protein
MQIADCCWPNWFLNSLTEKYGLLGSSIMNILGLCHTVKKGLVEDLENGVGKKL